MIKMLQFKYTLFCASPQEREKEGEKRMARISASPSRSKANLLSTSQNMNNNINNAPASINNSLINKKQPQRSSSVEKLERRLESSSSPKKYPFIFISFFSLLCYILCFDV